MLQKITYVMLIQMSYHKHLYFTDHKSLNWEECTYSTRELAAGVDPGFIGGFVHIENKNCTHTTLYRHLCKIAMANSDDLSSQLITTLVTYYHNAVKSPCSVALRELEALRKHVLYHLKQLFIHSVHENMGRG